MQKGKRGEGEEGEAVEDLFPSRLTQVRCDGWTRVKVRGNTHEMFM